MNCQQLSELSTISSDSCFRVHKPKTNQLSTVRGVFAVYEFRMWRTRTPPGPDS